MRLTIALMSQIIVFFYLRSWRPVVHYVQAVRLQRRIQAMRVAGLL